VTVFAVCAETVFGLPCGKHHPEGKEETRLAINRERKEELVAQYIDMLQRAKGLVITEYRGMKMQHLDELRSKLREKNASFTVTKNTLFKIALAEVGMAVPEKLLSGPVATVFAFEDLPATVKVVLEYADDQELFVAKGGILGETAIDAAQLEPISELPPLDVLRAQLLGMTTMPLSSFLSLLEEPSRQVVGVLKAATDGVVNVLAAYVAKEEAA
jgi:large subunit ribosomal protein L10